MPPCGIATTINKGNYISPWLYIKDCKSRMHRLFPKDKVTHGNVAGKLTGPITEQFVIVIDDHAAPGAAKRFVWGKKYVLEAP